MADPITSVALGVASAALPAAGSLMAGNAQADALGMSRFNQLMASQNRSTELKQAANEAQAAAGRDALEAARNRDMMLSKARANAGMSGGGVDDTSVAKTMAGIDEMGEFQKAMLLFGGENKARGLRYEANNAIYEGLQNDAATQYQAGMTRYKSRMDAMGTLLGGAGSALSDYTKYAKERDQNMRAALR